MNDYCNGIAYATGYMAEENGSRFLFVRNLDPHYAKAIEKESKYKSYESKTNIERDRKPQYCIKARDINSIPELNEISNINDFCRAYIEIHGVLDLATAKDRKGNYFKKPRLRIYGTEKVISLINKNLPAAEKKIQYIKNTVDSVYTGRTCAIYYQSASEIVDILNWIDGKSRNESVWTKWKEIIESYMK